MTGISAAFGSAFASCALSTAVDARSMCRRASDSAAAAVGVAVVSMSLTRAVRAVRSAAMVVSGSGGLRSGQTSQTYPSRKSS